MANVLVGLVEAMGVLFENTLLPVMVLFVAEGTHFAAGLALALIITAIVFMVWITVFRVLPGWLGLHLRHRQLQEIYVGLSTPYEKQSALAEHYVDKIMPAFGSGFESQRSRFVRNLLYRFGREKQLQLAWSEFRETIVDEDAVKIKQNTERPSDYFPRAIRPPREYAALSGVFVSIGLLLTFIGIIAVLLKAGCSMEPGGAVCSAFGNEAQPGDAIGSEAMQAAVVSIVAGAGSKFYASIGGLAASIIVRIWVNALSSGVGNKLDELCDEVEAGFAYMPEQTLAIEQLTELKEQSGQLKTFNTSLAVTMGEVFDMAVKPVTTELQNIKEGLSDQRRDLTTGVGEAVNAMAGGEIRELGRVLGDLRGELAGLSGKLSDGGESAARQLHDAAASMSDMTKSLQEQFAKMTDDVRQASADANQQFAGSADQIGNVLSGALEAINSSSAENSKHLMEMGQQLGDVTRKFGEEAQGTITKAMEAASEKTAESAAAAGSKLRDAMESAFEDWSTALRQAVDNITRLSNGLNNSAEIVEKQTTSMKEVAGSTERASEALQTASTSFQTLATPIQTAIAQLSDASLSVDETSQKLAEVTDGAFEKIQAVSESMQETMSAAEEAWDAYQDRFGEVDEKLGQILLQLSGALENNAQRMSDYVSQIDRELAGAVGRFGDAVQPLTDLADNLEDLNRDLQKAVGEGDN